MALGQEALIALTVTNTGPDEATATELKTTLAAGLSFVSATVTQGSVSNEGGLVQADLGQVAAGSSATLNVHVRADQPGLWTNTAVVMATEFDRDLTDNSVTDIIQIKPDADLTVALNATPDPVWEQVRSDGR